ncbi:MAG TPA: hypothetical protein VLJ59_15565 [Mycobacteriales bacterium]|nr:hypothetical protein [Mycobacteriales bacterium]
MSPPTRSVRLLVRLFALARTAIGLTLLARPETLARTLRVDAGTVQRTGWLTRMLAARELALGAGTLFALTRGGPARPWLAACAAVDAVDAGAMATAIRKHQVWVPLALLGAGGATSSVALHLAAVSLERLNVAPD